MTFAHNQHYLADVVQTPFLPMRKWTGLAPDEQDAGETPIPQSLAGQLPDQDWVLEWKRTAIDKLDEHYDMDPFESIVAGSYTSARRPVMPGKSIVHRVTVHFVEGDVQLLVADPDPDRPGMLTVITVWESEGR